jgi:GMP synthase (glutamine-hydrolysing)
MRVLVLQHGDEIPPGHLGEILEEAGAEVVAVMLHRGEPLPALDEWDAIVSLGAVEGVYDDDPWIAQERAFLREAAARDIAILGICFGSQILADALGGRAYLADGIEAGVVDVVRTAEGEADPVLRHLDVPVVAWHQDTFDPPPGATLLGSTDRYRHAFRVGRTLAIQAHPEAGLDVVDGWLAAGGREQLEEAGIDPEEVRARVAVSAKVQKEMSLRLFRAWVDGIER